MDQRGLVERASRGDHDAFGALVDGSIARLEMAARLILRDSELARDAVQEAMVSAWRNLPGLRDPERFDAWLYRLTIRSCLDMGRKKRRRVIEVELSPLDDVPITDASAWVADRDLIDRALHQLDPDQRAVVVLRYYLQLTLPEAAAALAIPLGTAKSRLHRALTQMRVDFQPDDTRPSSAMAQDRSHEHPRSHPREPPHGWSLRPRRAEHARSPRRHPRGYARARQRPAWSYPERWLPMAVMTRPAVAPSLRPLWLLLIALLIAALAVGGAIVGAGLLRSEAAIPMGGEAVFAFSSVAADAETPQHVMTIRADGTDGRQLTSPDGMQWRNPQFSPDGTHIAVRGWGAGTESIVVMDAAGGDPITIASFDTPDIDCIKHWEVAWSPDGSALAYEARDSCSAPSRIDIAGADGASPPVPLLEIDVEATSPTWSPDGTQIAFAGKESAGAWDVYVAPARCRPPWVAAWCPDG